MRLGWFGPNEGSAFSWASSKLWVGVGEHPLATVSQRPLVVPGGAASGTIETKPGFPGSAGLPSLPGPLQIRVLRPRKCSDPELPFFSLTEMLTLFEQLSKSLSRVPREMHCPALTGLPLMNFS